MSYGLCCVTEPRSRTALQLDIFIEIPPIARVDDLQELVRRNPPFCATSVASAALASVVAESRLFRAFTRCPVPCSPT